MFVIVVVDLSCVSLGSCTLCKGEEMAMVGLQGLLMIMDPDRRRYDPRDRLSNRHAWVRVWSFVAYPCNHLQHRGVGWHGVGG
jgi:hypothetical protein